MMSVKTEGRVAAGAAVAMLLLVWGTALSPGCTFAGMDFADLLLPQTRLVHAAFSDGVWPLWNWYTWGGSPLLAAMQSAPLYPITWVAALGPLPLAMQWSVVAHLVWAGLGAGWVARRILGVGLGPSVVASAAYGGSGFFLGHWEQLNTVASASWTPWIVGSMLLAANGHGVHLGAMAVAMSLLAGHPQYGVLAVLFSVVGCTVVTLLQRAEPAGVRLRRWVVACAVPALGLLVSGAQVLPTRELGALSERVRPYADPTEPALHPTYLPAIVIPKYYQRLTSSEGIPPGLTEVGLYSGMATFPLFLLGAVIVARRRTPKGIALLAIGVTAFLYALGRYGFVSDIAFTVVSYLRNSRGSARALAVALLVYSALGALGLQVILEGLGRRRGREFHPLFAGVACALVVAGDIALTHRAEKRERLIDVRVMSVSGSIPNPLRAASLNPGERIYRFMGNDSDYSLDNRPTAIANRRLRLQPNTPAAEGVRLCDGYEEGLLPTRQYANFMRGFHRNLWFETLDAPLLAVRGVRRVLTEYPTDKLGPTWTVIEQFTGLDGRAYAVLESAFEPAVMIAEGTSAAAPESDGRNFLLGRDEGIPFIEMNREWRQHEFSHLTPERWSEAVRAAGVASVKFGFNFVEFQMKPTERNMLWLQGHYPGWMQWSGAGFLVEPAGPILTRIRFGESALRHESAFRLEFRPFSFRLGMFLSLVGLGTVVLLATERQWRMRREKRT